MTRPTTGKPRGPLGRPARNPTDPAQLRLRFNEELRGRLERAAFENARSMNAEIIARLERSFAVPDYRERLEQRMEQMEKELKWARDKYEAILARLGEEETNVETWLPHKLRISLSNPADVQYWADKLEIPKERLLEVARKEGYGYSDEATPDHIPPADFDAHVRAITAGNKAITQHIRALADDATHPELQHYYRAILQEAEKRLGAGHSDGATTADHPTQASAETRQKDRRI